MFLKEAELVELRARIHAVLDMQKAGTASKREDLAELIANVVDNYIGGKYNAGNQKEKNKTGVVRLQDILTDEDIGRR